MKKAGIELGANLTMIVIISLLILGLALVFVLRAFQYAEDKTPKSAPEIIFHANADNPLYPEGKEIRLHPGESTELLVSVYNAEWSEEEDIYVMFTECGSEDGLPATGFSIKSLGQKIVWKRDKGYSAIIKVEEGVAPGTYVCSMHAGALYDENSINTDMPYHSRQISITVI